MARTTSTTRSAPRSGSKAAALTDRPRAPARSAKPAARAVRPEVAEGKKLVIVESPAKAKTINRYLGSDYIVKASMGHVRDLPAKGIGVDVDNGFAPTYELLDGRKRVLAELRKYARSASEVFLATDLDREGEAIAWHLAEALKIPAQRQRRVIFNEITKAAIQAAFAQPRQIDGNKVDAQQARRILDRIVGYMLSPLLWKKIATGLSAGRVQTVAVRLIVERERAIQAFLPEEFWRIGAVFTSQLADAPGLEQAWRQFLASAGNGPTQAQQLGFLADNGCFRAELVEWSGQRFNAAHADEAVKVAAALGLMVDKVDRQEDAAAKGPARGKVAVAGHLYADRTAALPPYVVESVESRSSFSRPPAPFNTASMQQAASIQLRFSASRTMRLAQQLYEGIDLPGEGSIGLITYMRTDSLVLATGAVEQVRQHIAASFGPRYLPAQPNIYRSAARAQAAHEAVRPTDATRTPQALKGALEGDLWRLYDLIWRRFVACQMTPAEWAVTDATIATQVSVDGQPRRAVFKTSGRKLVFDGFLAVAGLSRQDEQILPELAKGRPAAPVELAPTQHFTQPPPRYTEASLVKSLEAEGIGRPSTYAAIIQTIQDRQYVQQIERRFYATELGMKVVDKLLQHFADLFDIKFTARMEDRLDEIEDDRARWQQVLADFYKPFKADLDQAMQNMVHAKAESEPSEYACPACGKPMVYRWSKNGRYLACTGYPECKTTAPVDEQGKLVERKAVDVPCPNCGKTMVLRRSRFGPFLGCSDYPACKGVVACDKDGQPLKLVKEEDIKENCPDCGAPMAVKHKGRKPFLGCSRYPDCRATAAMPEGVRLQRPPAPPPQEAGINCPKCGKPMVIRTGRRGPFVACSGYPRCRNAFDLSKLEGMKNEGMKDAAPGKS